MRPREDSLTKTELVEIVDRIYASWNTVVPKSNEKQIYEAWWRIIGHLDFEDVHIAIDELVRRDSYMPRPGSVAAEVAIAGEDRPPTPEEAWAAVQKMGLNTASGIHTSEKLHYCVAQTIALLGGTQTFSMHTNGDRNTFTDAYNRVVESWKIDLIKNDLKKTTD